MCLSCTLPRISMREFRRSLVQITVIWHWASVYNYPSRLLQSSHQSDTMASPWACQMGDLIWACLGLMEAVSSAGKHLPAGP